MDTSDKRLGAVLSQGSEHPMLYINRKLSMQETKYSTIEKECLAIEWVVLTLQYYLLERAFTLCSDHTHIQWLHHMKDNSLVSGTSAVKVQGGPRPEGADSCSRFPLLGVISRPDGSSA